MFKFKVGDFVVRRSNVMDSDSPLMHGIVTGVCEARLQFGYYPELVDVHWVRWDSQKEFRQHTGHRYLPEGLQKEG